MRKTRSSIDAYDKWECFFCQKKHGRDLRSFKRSNLMKSAIETSANEILQIRFNSFCDAHAGDIKYHANCMVVNVDKVITQNQTENIKRYAVEEELVSKIEYGSYRISV